MSHVNHDIKNWLVTHYDINQKFMGKYIIEDRTENEAESEAIADLPLDCGNWTLMPLET